MKKINITSGPLATTPFVGDVVVVYSEEHYLLSISFEGAELTPDQRQWFKEKIPAYLSPVHSYPEQFRTDKLAFTDSTYEITFEMFWDAYGKKVNPHLCKPIWNSYTPAQKLKAYTGVRKYQAFLDAQSYLRGKADPVNYLKKKYWKNEQWQ